MSITVPGYERKNKFKPQQSEKIDKNNIIDNSNKWNLEASVQKHIAAQNRELAAKDLSAWMHQLQRGSVKDAVYGSTYLLQLVERWSCEFV